MPSCKLKIYLLKAKAVVPLEYQYLTVVFHEMKSLKGQVAMQIQ
jgi:hypothetical protein